MSTEPIYSSDGSGRIIGHRKARASTSGGTVHNKLGQPTGWKSQSECDQWERRMAEVELRPEDFVPESFLADALTDESLLAMTGDELYAHYAARDELRDERSARWRAVRGDMRGLYYQPPERVL